MLVIELKLFRDLKKKVGLNRAPMPVTSRLWIKKEKMNGQKEHHDKI